MLCSSKQNQKNLTENHAGKKAHYKSVTYLSEYVWIQKENIAIGYLKQNGNRDIRTTVEKVRGM